LARRWELQPPDHQPRRIVVTGQLFVQFRQVFDGEIVPLTSTKTNFNKDTNETTYEEVTLRQDEGNRPSTTLEGLKGLEPVYKDAASRIGQPLIDEFLKEAKSTTN